MESKRLNVADLITERVPLNDYLRIYNNFGGKSIASILEYPVNSINQQTVVAVKHFDSRPSNGVIGIIGAGNFTKMTVMPALKSAPLPPANY